jgi:hypothetical protein
VTRGDAGPEEQEAKIGQIENAEDERGAAPARRKLHALDAEIERVRRRLYAVETGLLVVPDRDSELAELSREYAELGERFVAAYREWQAAERAEAATSADL